MSVLLTGILVLGGIGLVAAIILHFVAQKFAVESNPRVQAVEKLLPGVNCGACGKAGCQDFARACASADIETFKGLYCSVGGNSVMQKIAELLGYKTPERDPTVAVLRCQGSCENAPAKFEFTGLKSCRLVARISTSQSECPYGCIRMGDCVRACKFGALHISPDTGLPVVDENKCVSCGACVAICPKKLFEIRPKGKDGKRVYVACRNQQKGAVARQNCKVACIGCMKCTKIVPSIKVQNNLSYIPTDVDAEKFGQELADTCPTGAIVYTGKKEQ